MVAFFVRKMLLKLLIFLALLAVSRGCKSRCTQPLAVGGCRARIPRFYYNPDLQKCQRFFYSGCDANANNFQSLSECHAECGGDWSMARHLKGTHCLQPHTIGQVECRAAIPIFWFNPQTLECEFTYFGGCMGSMNNFHSIEECMSSCVFDVPK